MRDATFITPYPQKEDSCITEQVKRGLYAHGVDAWWCDSSEPFARMESCGKENRTGENATRVLKQRNIFPQKKQMPMRYIMHREF